MICRICKTTNPRNVINLGEQVITSRFPLYGDFTTPKINIVLCLCENCGLLQLTETTKSSELYEYEYGYRSGISNTMREHLHYYQKEITEKVQLHDNDIVLDIGCNDGTMLKYYSSNVRKVGIDPTGLQFSEYYDNTDIDLMPTYFSDKVFKEKYGDNMKCKIISSISMFYDLPDPIKFSQDIASILHEDGIWTCEQSYMPTMLDRNSIDTICHEHLEYYSLTQIKYIAEAANLKICDVIFNDCNGGSFRIYMAKKSSTYHVENSNLVESILSDECKRELMNPETFFRFMRNCDNEIKKLQEFTEIVNKNNKKMYIYGASTKGNCLLQYAKLGEKDIPFAVERNLNKIGKMTSTGIPIINEETMRNSPPEYLLVLPWHFRDEIIKREETYLENGGSLVFPFPHFEIYSKKTKVLITGCDGMIAQYVKQELINANNYNLFGIGHDLLSATNINDNLITKTYFDMNDTNKLEFILGLINPSVIIHLASISSSYTALKYPIETINANGMVISNLCDIIYRNNWKHIRLFNASSSEIYKGHVNYTVEENDKNMHHCHPYSIAKIMGHSMVDFYRKTYNLTFSNGVIFTIESPLKRKEFLLNKVADHARTYKQNAKPLIVGNLDSYRNILHATDVAKAIHLIISQETGDNYLICNDVSHKMYDLVVELYKKNGITDTLPLIIENSMFGFDNIPTNITGKQVKLRELGWKPTITIDEILNELAL